MKVQIQIRDPQVYTVNDVRIGHIFTVKGKWPIYIKLRDGVAAIGEKTVGAKFGAVLYSSGGIEYTEQINWVSPEPFMLQGIP